MTHDIFLSYKREDEAHAAKLARALEEEGFSVWWDRSLVPADSWHNQIQAALDAAKCVVVIWTPQSTGAKRRLCARRGAPGQGTRHSRAGDDAQDAPAARV